MTNASAQARAARTGLPKASPQSIMAGGNVLRMASRDIAGDIQSVFKNAARSIRLDFRDLGGSLKDSLANVGRGLLSSLKSMGGDILQGLLGNLFGGSPAGGLFSSLLGGGFNIGSLLGFAGGGRVTPGSPVVVGERGPELIVPDRAATIMNNSDSRTAIANTQSLSVGQSIAVTADVRDSVRAQVLEMVPAIEGRVMDRMARTRAGIR